ncbi:N-acetylmuramic acid 6-phosphate etherase [Anaerobacillus alkaliphilus]|uniref:N-acetylmuramic acid 6-phosphate etherase n=1 Tax=Anaerobacillus alkaliphilus TaxID=1548597 RepID=A0A4Q0VVI9_9BACI|nr:N-acetylmuramic acid 6-phosphate etherase [Anaerobacillus alkaliphilus]RXJ02547.1 N-acetylmuramic acid 6-phosphate etherase [Anaerobacillus alkaliphilus]
METEKSLSALTTEQRNLRSKHIDQLSTIEILEIINEEDRTVAEAVQKVLPQIEKTVNLAYKSIKSGGRIFYVGAGTSGRLGILDAVECPPTFSVSSELVQGVIAGGETAIQGAVEGAEDDFEQGSIDLAQRELTDKDIVIGIAASGRTPYVMGALEYANQLGAETAAISCNEQSQLSHYANTSIEAVVGPEVLTGSTRMKAATAQKMILNMISTCTMIKLGKVYENLMVDVNASNHKLVERARNIVIAVTGVPYEQATFVLDETEQNVKLAIVMIETGASKEKAGRAIVEADGFVRKAIELLK